MIKTLIAIQARTDSKRFPNKMMADLCGKPVIQHVYERCLEASRYRPKVFLSSVAILLPLIEKIDKTELDHWCADNKVLVSYGSIEDLIERYDRAIITYEPDILIRVTGDEPVIPPNIIAACMDNLCTNDYCSNTVYRTYYDGCDCQGTWVNAWNKFFSKQKTYREHPFREFDMNESKRDEFEKLGFTWGQLINSNCSNQLKLSVDTSEDLENVRKFLGRSN